MGCALAEVADVMDALREPNQCVVDAITKAFSA